MQNFALLVGRLGLALAFVFAGIGKLVAYHATVKLLAAEGLAPGLLPIVIAIELVGGLAIACGLATRWAAAGLCLYTIVVALALHGHPTDYPQWVDLLRNFAVAGGFILLAAQGPGAFSLDAWRKRRRHRQKIFF